MNKITERIQYISQGTTLQQQSQHILSALDAGASWVQLRWKNTPKHAVSALATEVRKWCIEYKATFIINDNVELAKELDADGVHLGLNDMSIHEARSILGKHKIIGGTANTLSDVLQRTYESCDYIGLGPYRHTTTKEKLSPLLGLSGYQEIVGALKKQITTYPPIFAIGGILTTDIPGLCDAGIHGVAVSGLIAQQPDAIKQIKQHYNESITNSR